MLEVAAIVLVAAVSTTFVTDLAGSALKLVNRRRGGKIRVADEAHVHAH